MRGAIRNSVEFFQQREAEAQKRLKDLNDANVDPHIAFLLEKKIDYTQDERAKN